jgi:hypothetical protein
MGVRVMIRMALAIVLFIFLLYGLPEAETYCRGKLIDYQKADLELKRLRGWTDKEIAEGKINRDYKGRLRPDRCRTTSLIYPYKNPKKENDYIWENKTENNLEKTTEFQFKLDINNWNPEITEKIAK